MPKANPHTDPSGDILQAAVRETLLTDDAIRARLSTTLSKVLDHVDHILDHGAQPVKMRLINSIMTNAVKDSSRKQDEDEARQAGRAQMEQLFSAVLGGLQIKGKGVSVEGNRTMPDDAPPDA